MTALPDPESDHSRPGRPRPTGAHWALLLGIVGMIAAVLVPLAPVWADSTTVTWPERGRAAESTTAFFVPYAPESMHVDVPCDAVRSGQQRSTPTTLLSSDLAGKPNKGFAVTTADGDVLVLVGGRQVSRTPIPAGDCSVRLDSGVRGGSLRVGATTTSLPHDQVREVFAFTTDLSPDQADGMRVRARTSTWFESTPSAAKITLMAVQLALAAGSLALLVISGRRRRTSAAERTKSAWNLLRGAVDALVVAALAAWTVLGPRTPDDSFTEGIVRNALKSGAFTNYYRWENSAESPFTLVLHLVEPLVAAHATPLVLRIPSLVAVLATWMLLSRGALPVLLPEHARRPWVRALTAASLLMWWLPFDLGVRPEPFIALGSTAVLTCVLRGTDRNDGSGLGLLGLGGLAAGLTLAVNPVGITAAAPIAVLAPRIWRTLRGSGGALAGWGSLALVGCLASTGLVAMFADQTLYGAEQATTLHEFYGPNVAWFEEIRRYEYLLGFDEQGGLGRRLPVLVTLVLVVCASLLFARGARHLPGMRLSYVPVAGLALAVAMLWLTPSKWTHYFGALAGLGAVALTGCLVLFTVVAREHEWTRHRTVLLISAAGTAATVLAISLSFSGTNTWFLFSHYGVPDDDAPLRPLNSPILWSLLVAVLLGVTLVPRFALPIRAMLVRMPAILGGTSAVLAVAVLLVSFAVAPARQAGGYSVGKQGLQELTGDDCGIVDDVDLIRDVDVLRDARGTDELSGFTSGGGYRTPPPSPPGTGNSTRLWGSAADGALSTGELTSGWFGLPALRANQELALSASGRTGDGNRLTVEFGRTDGGVTRPLGTRVLDDSYRDEDERPKYPTDRVEQDEPQDNPSWRELRVNRSDIPEGADTVRVRAVDATTDPGGWLAVTGPRIRQVEPLRPFLQGRPDTYVDWSMTWAAPCVRDVPKVAGGLAQAPTTLLNPPANLGFDGKASYVQAIGGSFTGVDEVGRRQVLPTRLRGSEDTPQYADWGQVVRVTYPVQRDAYDTSTTADLKWGWQGPPALLGDAVR